MLVQISILSFGTDLPGALSTLSILLLLRQMLLMRFILLLRRIAPIQIMLGLPTVTVLLSRVNDGALVPGELPQLKAMIQILYNSMLNQIAVHFS